jgi:hypothetical protein
VCRIALPSCPIVSDQCSVYAVTDSLWMPLWKALVKTPTWYCEVDGDSVGVPQNVVDLPIRRDGFTRFVFFSDTHSKHELIGLSP